VAPMVRPFRLAAASTSRREAKGTHEKARILCSTKLVPHMASQYMRLETIAGQFSAELGVTAWGFRETKVS
jgi:hypothetical protein